MSQPRFGLSFVTALLRQGAMQASAPREPNFVSGASSRPDVVLQAIVELETDAASRQGLAPGQVGIVAVRAAAVTRADVFDALHDRRTYAITGSRIVLDVSVAGVEMGGQGEAAGPVGIRCTARGTDVVDLVEVLRHAGGQPGFRVIASLCSFAETVDWSVSDDPPRGPAICYVRLRQRTPVRGRIPMAWSSPVWLEVRGAG